MNLRQLSYSFLLLGALSCQEKQAQNPTEYSKDEFMEYSKAYNKELKDTEEQAIESYIAQSSLTFEKTKSGFYMTPVAKLEKPLQEGEEVVFSYEVRSLQDSVIYSKEEIGLNKITLGKAVIPMGVEYALKEMQPGDSACIVVPSSLAYGLKGDGDRIAPDQVLIFEIKIPK